MVLYIIIFISILTYGFLIGLSINGWNKKNSPHTNSSLKTFTVVVAVRNEEEHIYTLLSYLKKQNYPKHLFSVLIINDHSEDSTEIILKNETINFENLTYHNLPQGFSGKKAALEHAISFITSDYILYTDADCTMNENWISTYSSYIQPQSKLIFGTVDYRYNSSILQNFYALDFLSMVAVQGGLANQKRAFSCNGANICISKSELTKSRNTQYSSGDDVFILHSIKKENKNSITFIKNSNAQVYTAGPKSIHEFINQRIRWSSKATGYKDLDSILVSTIVYFYNALLFYSGIISIFKIEFLHFFISLLISKTILDIVFFYKTLPYFKRTNLLPYSIPFQFFYFIYITLIPIFGIIIPLKWKGRTI